MALVGNILGFYRRDNPRKLIKRRKSMELVMDASQVGTRVKKEYRSS